MSDFECLKSLVSSLSSVVVKLESAVRDIPEAINKLSNHIVSVENSVCSHDDRISALEKKLSALSDSSVASFIKCSEPVPSPGVPGDSNLYSDIVRYHAEEKRFASRSCNILWFKVSLKFTTAQSTVRSLLLSLAHLSGDSHMSNLIQTDQISGLRLTRISSNSNSPPPIRITCTSKDIRDNLITLIRKFKPAFDTILRRSFVRREYLPSEIKLERELWAECNKRNSSTPNTIHYVRDFAILSKPVTSPTVTAESSSSSNNSALTITNSDTNASSQPSDKLLVATPLSTEPLLSSSSSSTALSSDNTHDLSPNPRSLDSPSAIVLTEPPAKITCNSKKNNVNRTEVFSTCASVNSYDQRPRKYPKLQRASSLPRSSSSNLQQISSALNIGVTVGNNKNSHSTFRK
ncbi:unnamed protein product [Auanema sp. JU1783]|nr:unnamed protein product [Auanema sp. JU1783]